MERKRKRYFYEENAQLTDYMKRKIKRSLNEVIELSVIKDVQIDDDDDDISNSKVQFPETSTINFTLPMHYENYEQQWYEDGIEDSSIDGDTESLSHESGLFTNEEKFHPHTIHSLLNMREFMESIESTVIASPVELLLLSLQFSLKCSLSLTNITHLLKFVNFICNKKVLPETRFTIDKLCDADNKILLYAMCLSCSKILGTFIELDDFVTCSKCKIETNAANPSNACYFALVDPSDSIREYLETFEDYYDYVVKERVHEKNHLKDIYDGKLYRKFLKGLNENDRYAYVTAICNTDGAPVFECTNYSIYPIYLLLNEIPPNERLKNIILVGLWYGSGKPEMSAYLEIFVESMNKLSRVGIPCTIKGEKRNIKLFVIHSSVDTVARCTMNGTVQFNGKYGCDWCIQKGVYFAGSMRYPYLEESAKHRSRNLTIKWAKKSLTIEKPVRGVKIASPLLLLKEFNIVEGFSPDYMHCILSGVTLQFTEYFVNELSAAELDFIDTQLLKIKVPHQVARLTRKLSDRSDWKAREWENWLLYYSIPILELVIKNKRLLKHFSLLVDSIYLLLKSDITFEELNEAKDMLNEFSRLVTELYSLKAMTYNVHQLPHLCESVCNWGPIWAHSTFPFESANHYLLSAIQCGKGVISQIIRYYNLQRVVKVLKHNIDPDCSKTVIEYCENLYSCKYKNTLKISSITYFGKRSMTFQNYIEQFNVSKKTKMFKRLVINGCLFTSSKKENVRSCNYFAQLESHEYIQIIYFLVDEESNKELTVCQLIQTRPHKYSKVIDEIVKISPDITSVQTKDILKPCVCIETDKKKYIIATPNILCYS